MTGTPSSYKVGQVVALRSDPSARVAITDVIGGVETSYRVFQDGREVTYYESQLQPSEEEAQTARLSADELRAFLTSLHLLSPSNEYLYSLRSGRVNFVPYQYRPVMKIIRSDRPRLLIADEVGVGKTIEAGLILKELRARMDINSVLVICPKPLVAEHKWFREMKRFDEHFEQLDGKTLRHCIRETKLEGAWPDRYNRSIIPFSLFNKDLVFGKDGKRSRAGDGLFSLDPPPNFDLVIVDEAHHIRNSDTIRHQAVRYFCDNAEAAIFLTATPVQLGSENLFTLLNVLRPDLVTDKATFELMAKPNSFIYRAESLCRQKSPRWPIGVSKCLKDAAATEWGRIFLRELPEFHEINKSLQASKIDEEGRLRIIRSLEQLNSFSSMINRTRRRDIGEFTMRTPKTVTVEFTPAQLEVYEELLEVITKILTYVHGDLNVKFVTSMISRQASSSIHGLAPLLRDTLNGKVEAILQNEEADADDTSSVRGGLAALEEIRADIGAIITKAEALGPDDPKVEAFLKVLQEKSQMAKDKALVFTTFRHTLAYLEMHVRRAGLRCGVVHGDVAEEERNDLRHRFALDKDDPEALEVLLSSEVASEGLDFQFCDLLVNYDLPWNPMRIEQRIGRLDRYGQKSDSVVIVNMVTPGTIDADIYDRCLERIGIFRSAIGGSEEILGEITKGIQNIVDDFDLTPRQRDEQLSQLADNKIRQIQEEGDLENKQLELFGLVVPDQSWRKELEESESFWLSAAAVQRCVATYLSEVAETDGGLLQGDRPLKSLRLSQEAKRKLLDDLRSQSQSRSPDHVTLQWEKWLKGSEQRLSITFDQETAAAEPEVVYLDVLHPLVRQSATYLQRSEAVQVSLAASSGIVPLGAYPFALYHWRTLGLRPNDKLVAVASAETLDDVLLSLLETASEYPEGYLLNPEAMEHLEKRHHRQWREARERHITEQKKLMQNRLERLKMSYETRDRYLQAMLDDTTTDFRRQMMEGQRASAKRDYEQRHADHEALAKRADIHSSLVVSGTLHIR